MRNSEAAKRNFCNIAETLFVLLSLSLSLFSRVPHIRYIYIYSRLFPPSAEGESGIRKLVIDSLRAYYSWWLFFLQSQKEFSPEREFSLWLSWKPNVRLESSALPRFPFLLISLLEFSAFSPSIRFYDIATHEQSPSVRRRIPRAKEMRFTPKRGETPRSEQQVGEKERER